MAKVKIQGHASGTGILTVTAPDTDENRTITLPDATGTLLTEVADDAITLAKMASGTDGNIISYDASGNPVAIATGTDGQVLTSAGAGAPPAFEDAAGGNAPYFYVDKVYTARQNVSEATQTKITMDNNQYDPDDVYDAVTNYRFTVPSGKAGQYFISAGIEGNTSTAQDMRALEMLIKKNGSTVNTGNWMCYSNGDSNGATLCLSMVLDLSVSDYVEVWGSIDTVSNAGTNYLEAFFTGFKIG